MAKDLEGKKWENDHISGKNDDYELKMTKKQYKVIKNPKKGSKTAKNSQFVFNYTMCRDPFFRDKKSFPGSWSLKKKCENRHKWQNPPHAPPPPFS